MLTVGTDVKNVTEGRGGKGRGGKGREGEGRGGKEGTRLDFFYVDINILCKQYVNIM